jgi:4'-phosphopantetheinyl transferase
MKVHWLEQTEADVPWNLDWLSASEAACLNAMRVPKRRSDWQLGRWTAKCALSAYLNIPGDLQSLSDIEIRPAASGVPEAFVAGQPAPASISISHSNGTALCAIAPFGVALGCDLELIEPRSDAFIADYFTAGEQALLAQASASERSRILTLLWSAKESALKALHEGLRQDIRSVTVTLLESAVTSMTEETGSARPIWHGLEVRHVDGAVFHGWWLQGGNLLRTLVAAPRPMTMISLAMNG